ncbi:hypothetical protein TNCV_3208321 [Trichonephila clavipes]|nr:hypothetical protein TNCV_3208321 [Trichonephila clavipes]
MGLESDKAGQSRTGRQRASERCVRHGYEIKTIFCEMRLPVLPSQGSTHDLTIGDLFGDWRVRNPMTGQISQINPEKNILLEEKARAPPGHAARISNYRN